MLCMALCRCFVAAGETNSASTASLFAMPTPQLRELNTPAQKAHNITLETADNSSFPITQIIKEPDHGALAIAELKAPSIEYSFTSRLTTREMEVYRRLDEGGYLTRPEPETPIEQFMTSTFSPEVIHLGKGKAVAGFSLYTAIKRKNPLCLLNPMVLFFSW